VQPFGWHRGARTSESLSISEGFPFSTDAGWVFCGATYLCVGQYPLMYQLMGVTFLTPKNGTGKGLTCGPILVVKYHSARKNLLRGIR
jgi:hypothetical protein